MQTFLPYADFAESARALDDKRLGKQRVECLQVLNVFAGVRAGWANHPVTRMWQANQLSLLYYGLVVCRVWIDDRGFRDTCAEKMIALSDRLDQSPRSSEDPFWLGDPALHTSHQSNLVRKFPERYRPMFPDVQDDLEYVWPVS